MENHKMSLLEQSFNKSNTLDPWFITGFSDGEAAFTYNRSGRGLALCFSIRLRADDSSLLNSIQRYFGVGKIYYNKESLPNKNSGHSKPSLYYRVSKVIELIKIIHHFDKYPLMSKKAKAYKVWREMAILKQNLGKPDFNKINQLSLNLSRFNSKSRKFNVTNSGIYE